MISESQISPSILIAVPTFNSAHYLPQTLVSLLSQKTNYAFKIVAVDSNSQDNTLDILKNYNICTIFHPPGNMYAAIDRAFKEYGASYQWLTYVNSDDCLFETALQTLITVGEASCASLVYGSSDYINNIGQFLYHYSAASPKFFPHLIKFRQLPFAQHACIFRTVVYESLCGFDLKYRYCADADFFLRAYMNGFKYAHCTNATVAAFRIHENQLTHIHNNLMKQENDDICKKLSLGPKTPIDYLYFLARKTQNLSSFTQRLMRRIDLH